MSDMKLFIVIFISFILGTATSILLSIKFNKHIQPIIFIAFYNVIGYFLVKKFWKTP
jgi:uncharacterized membrane protein YoaK (UPF0700 family)